MLYLHVSGRRPARRSTLNAQCPPYRIPLTRPSNGPSIWKRSCSRPGTKATGGARAPGSFCSLLHLMGNAASNPHEGPAKGPLGQTYLQARLHRLVCDKALSWIGVVGRKQEVPAMATCCIEQSPCAQHCEGQPQQAFSSQCF